VFLHKLQKLFSRTAGVEQSSESDRYGLQNINSDDADMNLFDDVLKIMSADEVKKLNSLLLRERDKLDDEYVSSR